MTRFGALAATIAAFFLLPAGCEDTAWADASQCGPAKTMIDGLKTQYDEVPNFTGAFPSGAAATVTVSPKGTWTLLVTAQPDQLCIIAAGDQWQAVSPSAATPKAAPGNLPDPPSLLEHGLILIRQ